MFTDPPEQVQKEVIEPPSPDKVTQKFCKFFSETTGLFLNHARTYKSPLHSFRSTVTASFDDRHHIAIGNGPRFIRKSGKKAPRVDYLGFDCASAIKYKFKILGLSIVDADAKVPVSLRVKQPSPPRLGDTNQNVPRGWMIPVPLQTDI